MRLVTLRAAKAWIRKRSEDFAYYCGLEIEYILNHLSFDKARWAFPAVVTLHNLEEAKWLHGLWQSRAWHVPVSAIEFRIVAGVVAILACFVTYLSR